jgi:hypothetical protein
MYIGRVAAAAPRAYQRYAPGVLPRFDEIRTPRLLMRHWRESDREPFAALNADPVVMRHY